MSYPHAIATGNAVIAAALAQSDAERSWMHAAMHGTATEAVVAEHAYFAGLADRAVEPPDGSHRMIPVLPCDYHHNTPPDQRPATWGLIGEAGDYYVCDEHHVMRTEEGRRGWHRLG